MKKHRPAPILEKISHMVTEPAMMDEQVIMHARQVIADTVGTAFSGVKTEAFRSAFSQANLLFGSINLPVWGTGLFADLSGAVFYNSLAVSSTDFDEGHRKAVGHPASLIVPLAIALGEQLEKPFSEVIRSVIIGYEIGTRFSHARKPEKVTTWSSGRWGGLASAATASFLLGLTTTQTMHALGNAAVLSPAMIGGTTDVSSGSMSKEGVAWAALAGLQSAVMSKNGFTGPYLFVDDTNEYNTDLLTENLGRNWMISSNYFKPYACCRWLHPAIAAYFTIKKENNFPVLEIEKIEVDVFSRAIRLVGSLHPENRVQAQFHIPYSLACGVLYNEVLPEYFDEKHLESPELQEMTARIALIENETFTHDFPGKLRSRVKVILKNKKTFSAEISSLLWDAGNHPSEAELFEKFIRQAGQKNANLWKQIMTYTNRIFSV